MMPKIARPSAAPPRGGGSRSLTVLHAVPRFGPNPYLALLAQALENEGVRVRPFSWQVAFFGKYDVLHVHWPEYLIRGRRRTSQIARRTMTNALLALLKLRGVPVVRTTHNHQPHDAAQGRSSRTLRRIDTSTSVWIRLADANPTPAGARTLTVRHGHYRDWYPLSPIARVPRRLLMFGTLKTYKGVDSLLRAFTESTMDAELRFAGRPGSEGIASVLQGAAQTDGRISTRLAYLSDDELADEIAAASLVVLPYGGDNNSGAAILALSLGRPILIPANPLAEELSAEIGGNWVRQFEGELTGRRLTEALVDEDGYDSVPDLSLRAWPEAARLHRSVYETVWKHGRSLS